MTSEKRKYLINKKQINPNDQTDVGTDVICVPLAWHITPLPHYLPELHISLLCEEFKFHHVHLLTLRIFRVLISTVFNAVWDLSTTVLFLFPWLYLTPSWNFIRFAFPFFDIVAVLEFSLMLLYYEMFGLFHDQILMVHGV